MRILVTGGTGFIGSHLVAALCKRGDELVCLVRKKISRADKSLECVVVDLADLPALRHCLADMKPCDAIIHFGARLPLPSWTSLSPYLDTNVGATSLLLESAVDWGVHSFVYASSITVVKQDHAVPIREDSAICPEHPYSVSKYQAEMACEYFRHKKLVPTCSLRISSPYGPGMSPLTVLPLFVNRARESKDILLYGTGARTQNFIHVLDVVRAVLLAMETGAAGIYNVAGTSSTSMQDLAHQVVKAVPGSASQVKLAGQPDPQEECRWDIDTRKAEQGFGFRAQIDLPAGLADYVRQLDQGDFIRWWQPCA